MRSMRLGKIAIIDWPNHSAVIFFHISAGADPFRTQRWKTLFHVAAEIRIAPRPASIVNAHRLIRFNLSGDGLGRGEGDFAERDTNIGMQFARNVHLFGIWTLAVRRVHAER